MNHSTEKRVTLRFRMDKARDQKAYNNLIKRSEAQNSSLNEVILELLVNANKSQHADNVSSLDIDRLASMIAEKIRSDLPLSLNQEVSVVVDYPSSEDVAEDILDENALSFLDGFGIE